MEKIQIYLPKEDRDTLRQMAKRSGRSVAALVREAIRKLVLDPSIGSPVGVWDGIPKRKSLHHDTVYDEV